MKILALLQARLKSRRLPGKVLRVVDGKPLLGHLVSRLKCSRLIDEIVIATSSNPEDKKILRFAKASHVKVFAGSENDVLDRAYQAVKQVGGDIIVRITGDSPLLDPWWLDRLIRFYLKNRKNLDWVAFSKSFPEGQNAEVFSFEILETAWKEAELPSEREHFTSFIWKQPSRFRIHRIEAKKDYSKYRWTVDEPSDLKLVRAVLKKKLFRMEQIAAFLDKNLQIKSLNASIIRDQGYALSIGEDPR